MLFGGIYQHYFFVANGYLFYLFFVFKSNAVQWRSYYVQWQRLIWATGLLS